MTSAAVGLIQNVVPIWLITLKEVDMFQKLFELERARWIMTFMMY